MKHIFSLILSAALLLSCANAQGLSAALELRQGN